jgi:hypothetical protein
MSLEDMVCERSQSQKDKYIIPPCEVTKGITFIGQKVEWWLPGVRDRKDPELGFSGCFTS